MIIKPLFFDRISNSEQDFYKDTSQDDNISNYIKNIENILNSRSTLKVNEFLTSSHIPPAYLGMPSDLHLYMDDTKTLNAVLKNIVNRIDTNVSYIEINDIQSSFDSLKIILIINIFNREKKFAVYG